MSYTFQKPREHDAVRLGLTQHTTWKREFAEVKDPHFWGAFSEDSCVEYWRERLLNPDPRIRTLVAHAGANLLGGIVIGPAGAERNRYERNARDLEIGCIFVLPDFQGNGIGASLLARLLTPSDPAQLWIGENVSKARRFFRTRGFVFDGSIDTAGQSFGGQSEIRLVR